MTKPKHTPGPWKLQKFKDGPRQPVGPDDFFTTAYVSGADSVETQANAKLIAAAPELVEFLLKHQKSFEMFFEGLEGVFSDSKRTMNDLIRKATGGES